MEVAVVLLPLLGAIIAGLFGRYLGDRGSMLVTCILLSVSAILSWVLFYVVALNDSPRTVTLFSWMDVAGFTFSWALLVDQLTAVMLIVVTTVSAVVHWYSIGYMEHDPGKPRFFAYLSLFTFFMLILVLLLLKK